MDSRCVHTGLGVGYSIIIPTMSDNTCVFCNPPTDRVIHEDELVVTMWDGFPVSPGHVLVVPRRHVARTEIEKDFAPDGYNIGINDGAAAGQTVLHLHLHVIPRYEGDVEDPRGGIRHVIPAKADYWSR